MSNEDKYSSFAIKPLDPFASFMEALQEYVNPLVIAIQKRHSRFV
jgi:hypothetical protein